MGTRKNNTGLFKKQEVNIGEKFGMLTVIKECEPRGVCKSRPNGYRYFLCRCDCGNESECNYSKIKTGRTRSCGCLISTTQSNRMKGNTIWVGRTHSQETKEKMRKYDNTLRNLKVQIRESDNYKKWRKLVYEKDNYTCVVSGKKGSGDLEAHHLQSMTNLIKKYNITSIHQALDCKELWIVDNGVTLNKEIHNQFHREYGFGYNTPEQFYEFNKQNYAY